MTLTSLLSVALLEMFTLFQTGSIPIWVPLSIILLIILLLWWGLTRNNIPEENDAVADDMAEEHKLDEVVDEPIAVNAAASEPTDTAVDEEDEGEPIPVDIAETPIATEPDDLKVIEGIGPKIAGLLADAGITSFADLAAADPEQLNQIVRVDGGIKVADPSTWPEQAVLAASGDWDGLEELQNRLVAGRHRA